MKFISALKNKLLNRPSDSAPRGSLGRNLDKTMGAAKFLGYCLGLAVLILAGLGFYWNSEPELFDVAPQKITGSTTIRSLISMTDILLDKRGGYLTNDITPPGILLDNIPSWEFGVIVQMRDMTRTLRNNLSRSQSQSTEDPDLVKAENQFYFDNDSWVLPATETEYAKGREALKAYLIRLEDSEQQAAQFYARADNLQVWLSEVETRMGSLSQRLSASVGKRQLDISLAGDEAATQSTRVASEQRVKTAWLELDDVFYEARGTTWALIHLLRAIEVDFREVLEKKNALVSLRQIIRELEPTQDTVWSPMVLNGSGLGLLANHSLVMGSYISRANAAVADLRRLLEDG